MKMAVIGVILVSTVSAGSALETYNRGMGRFNRGVDKYVLTPAAKGYRAVMPDAGERGVSNVIDNVGEVRNVINNGAQGEGGRSWTGIKRFAINTTAGVLGIFDVASRMGIEEERATFDETLESYGVGEGAYVEVPVLGGMTARQMAGFAGDAAADPINHTDYRMENSAAKSIDSRARRLREEEKEEGA